MVTPTDSSSSYRNRGSGHFVSSFEKSSIRSEMKSSGNNGRNQRFPWNGIRSANEPLDNEGHRHGPSSPSTASISPSHSKRDAKIVTNVNTTNKLKPNSFVSRKNDQWNVNRDIPAGTVRNNPFLPKPKPQPPQLKHQKRQWDTSNIPRGSVAARIQESRSPRKDDGGSDPISPSKIVGGSNGRPSQLSTNPRLSHLDSNGRLLTSDSPRSNKHAKSVTSNPSVFSPKSGSSPWQTKSISFSSEQKKIEQQASQCLSSGNNEKRDRVTKNQLEPPREVPNRTVKARLSSLYRETKPTEVESKLESVNAKNVVYHQSARGVAAKETMLDEDVKIDNDNDEDPWIIPERTASNTQVFADDWGEAVVPTKSAESDDWETPAKDWSSGEAEQKSSRSENRNFHRSSILNQQQYNTSGSRDVDGTILQSDRKMIPVSDNMAGARVQPPQALRGIETFQVRKPQKVSDRTTNRNVTLVLAPPPKDANTYHQPQGRVSKNRTHGDVDVIGSKSGPSSSKVFDNSFSHFTTKTGMMSSISIDDAKLERSFGKSGEPKIAFRTRNPSAVYPASSSISATTQDSKKQLNSSDAFGSPPSSREMHRNGNRRESTDVDEEYFDVAASNKNNACDRSRINERNSMSHRPSPITSNDEGEEGYDSSSESNLFTGDSKKKKKGFFKGLFGRKAKEKKENSKNKEMTTDKKNKHNRNGLSNSKSSVTGYTNKDDPYSDVNSKTSNTESQGQTIKQSSQRDRQPGNLTIDTMVDHSSQEENHCEDLNGRKNHVLKRTSVDNIIVSNTTNPIVFKGTVCPPSSALNECPTSALSTIGDIPDESVTHTVSPMKLILVRDSNCNDSELEYPSTATLSKIADDDTFVDPELDHLDVEIDSEDDEMIVRPPSKSMLVLPPPPESPPQLQRKGADSNIRQNSREGTRPLQKESNTILQDTVETGGRKNVENKKSTATSQGKIEATLLLQNSTTVNSETVADKSRSRRLSDRSREIGPAQNDTDKSDPLLQEAKTQGDSCDYSREKIHSHQTGLKEDNSHKARQDRTTLRGTSPFRNVLQRDSGRPRIKDTSPAKTTLRRPIPSRNAAKLEGQASIRNTTNSGRKESKELIVSRGVSPARNAAKLPGRIRFRDTISPGRVDTQESIVSRGTSPGRNAPKLPGRMKLGDTSPARKDDTHESDIIDSHSASSAGIQFSRPASRKLRDLSPVENNVDPMKSRLMKSSIVQQKTRLEISSLQTKKSAQLHSQQSLIISKEHSLEETNIPSRYRKKTVFNNKQSIPIATDNSGYSRHLASRKTQNVVTGSQRSSFSSQTSQDTKDDNIKQSKQFSKTDHAHWSIVEQKKRSEVVEDKRKYFSIPAASTSASDLSCSSSTYDNYQKKLADSLRKANIGSQSSVEYSVQSHRSLDDSSIESDIRILRSILRRPRLDQDNENVITASRKIEGFPTYDEESSTDPMQRVGLRLLSTAIIPIQTEVRRFLAMRHALTRMWALIVVQTYTRRFLAKKHYRKALYSITVIQATFRGHRARNYIIDKHICAIEIQRFVRGYLATMQVYEEIYKVTLIQSLVRKRIAMNLAAYRMALVIQLQAAARGFLARKRRFYLDTSATVIQSCWRCFYNRLTYQFDLLDIIIVQSLWRRKLGIRAAVRKFKERQNSAATIVQAEWRAYDCRMDFICYLAARNIQTKWRSYICRKHYTECQAGTIIQSVARMYSCRLYYVNYLAATMIQSVTRMYFCRVDYVDYRAATMIQSAGRMYLCRSDYVDYQAATIVQSVARMYLCRSDYVEYQAASIIQSVARMYCCRSDYVDYQAATAIQSLSRMYRCRSDYVGYQAAVMIQSVARMYSCRSDYVEYQAATMIQSAARMYMCRMDYVDYQAATTIQSIGRMYLCRLDYVDYQAATAIQSVARMYLCHSDYVDFQAATIIQSVARMYLCRLDYIEYQAATTIQSVARMFLCRSDYISYQAATIIQAAWRSHDCRMDYVFYTAARKIQTIYRSSTCRKSYVTFIAARKIQTIYRSSTCKKYYVTFIAARKIQTIYRSSICREDYLAFIAARKIQTIYRSSICRKDYLTFMAARKIQTIYRSSICRKDYLTFMAARKIQTNYRAYVCRKEYIENFAATMIQTRFRSYNCSSMYHRYCAARIIQKTWRSYDCKMNYLHFLADILIVQSTIRRFLVQKQVKAMKYRAATAIQRIYRGYACLIFYTETVAATAIQRTFRGFVCYADYEEFKAARKIQSTYRGFVCKTDYKREKSAITIQSAWRSHTCFAFYKEYMASRKIQSEWRRYTDRSYYVTNIASRKIQSEWRRHVDHSHYTRFLAARKIQTIYRSSICREDYLAYIAARKIQTIYRSSICRKNYLAFIAARKIQSAWRAFVNYADHQEFLTVRKIQTAYRAFYHFNNFKRNTAAIMIQAALRGFVCKTDYKREKSAIAIQSAWRGLICFIDLHEYLTVRKIQTVFRGYLHLNSYKRFIASRKIQTIYRSSICRKDYLAFIAARKIQSTYRGFVCKTDYKREKSAIAIQSAWRGFLSYADFMFEVADIVVVQKQVRGWLARREANRRWHIERNNAATTIQKHWRRFVDETEFTLMKYEYHAATTIQTYWKRFWCFSNFIIALDCSIQIQAQMRGHLQKKKFTSQKVAAVVIQCAWRKTHAKQLMNRLSVIHKITKMGFEKGKVQSEAAIRIQQVFRGSLSRAALKVYLSAVKIQSRVRGAQARVAIKLYLMVRKIQTVYRGHTPYRKYARYIAVRKIQTTWRGCHSRRKYALYIAACALYTAARKIQTVYRGHSPRRNYVTFIAARCIQNKWRYAKANQEVLVMRGEFLAASLIQTAWRAFVCYTDFVFTLSDIVAAQRIARGYLTRKKYSAIIRSKIVRKKNELNSVILIQRVCRGFQARQNYWYTLGCTMQIQSWWRGRVVYHIMKRQSQALLVLQCFARRCLARQEYMQRRFVFLLIQTAEAERVKKIKALKIQEKIREETEERQRNAAALVIQRFFLYVKHEVDQLVFVATKRRKKWRKKMKTEKRPNDVDETLLEDVWSGLVALVEEEPFTRHYTNFGPGSVGEDSVTRSRVRKQQLLVDNICRRSDIQLAKSQVVRLQYEDDDNASEFSQLTGSTMAYAPHPTTSSARMIRKIDAVDIDDDFQLEEAFIDAEIHYAKERRHLAGNKSKKKESVRRW